MGVRAGIVVTGTEVLTGRVADDNGPWLADELRRLGVDVGQMLVVGDRLDDIASGLRFLAAANDLVVVTGGLGPTADDLTVEAVARVQDRPLALDPALEKSIAATVERLRARFGPAGGYHPAATATAIRKQATVPTGAIVVGPVGTAPGLVVPVAAGRSGATVVVLPGPPGEMRRTWAAAATTAPVATVLAGAGELCQCILRLWRVPESELAALLRAHDAELSGLEISTCLRAGELEIVARFAPAARPAWRHLAQTVGQAYPRASFSPDGATVDELVARLLT